MKHNSAITIKINSGLGQKRTKKKITIINEMCVRFVTRVFHARQKRCKTHATRVPCIYFSFFYSICGQCSMDGITLQTFRWCSCTPSPGHTAACGMLYAHIQRHLASGQTNAGTHKEKEKNAYNFHGSSLFRSLTRSLAPFIQFFFSPNITLTMTLLFDIN